MWTTIALLTVLGAAPAESGLSLTHVRSTHGLLGPQRRNETLAPGDNLFLCFDINGIRVDAEGKVRYSMAMELSDAAGKVVFRRAAKEQEARASLGGDSVPAYAHLSVGLDTPSGDYQMKVVVKDLASGQEQSLTRNLKVLAKDFALVRTTVTLDAEAQYPAAVFARGQGVWVHTSAVGFARDRNKKSNVVFAMRVLDESGKPTLAKAVTDTPPEDLPTNLSGLEMAFPLTLNRPGKFTVELQATDRISGKKAKRSFPIVVQGTGDRQQGRARSVSDGDASVAYASGSFVAYASGSFAEAPVVARLVSKDGTLFVRSKPDQDWQTIAAKGEIRAGDLLVGLPGAVIETRKGPVDLTLLADLDKNSPYPILEAAVVLHASADHDLDFTLDRGRVDVTNLKKQGAARVRIRFHDQQWEATLNEPGTRIALQLYGRWAKGVPFRKKPGPKDVPAADLLLVVRKGQAELKHGSCYCVLSAPPGPALLHWDNSGDPEEAPQKLDKLPDWTATDQSDSERAQRIKMYIEKLRQQVVKSSPREAARALAASEDPNERATAVIFMGALDDLEGLAEVLDGTKYPDAWDRAVVVVRHWLGRCPGQDQLLYQGLLDKRGLKPAQAAGVMQLLHSFGDVELAQPELYTTLVKYLGNEELGIRGLAHWHLVRLVPDGAKFNYNPLGPKDKRAKARDQWKKLIDDLLAKGELPPKQPAK